MHSPDAPCDCANTIVPATGTYLVIDGIIRKASRAYVQDVTATGHDWRVLVDDA